MVMINMSHPDNNSWCDIDSSPYSSWVVTISFLNPKNLPNVYDEASEKLFAILPN